MEVSDGSGGLPVYVFAETLFERLRDAGHAGAVIVSTEELQVWHDAAEALETELLEFHERARLEE